jgi:hypothetical protein
MNIADQTEEQLIHSILAIYSKDEQMCRSIANHIAIKLSIRRAIIRERRKAPACQQTPTESPASADSES